jgi:hypothetical protein
MVDCVKGRGVTCDKGGYINLESEWRFLKYNNHTNLLNTMYVLVLMNLLFEDGGKIASNTVQRS